MATAETLPAIPDVDAADNKLGSFMSDLDALVGKLRKLDGEVVPVEEHLRLHKLGMEIPEREVDVTRAEFARLLVFADELGADGDRIKEDAAELRRHLLSLYRWHVLDKAGDDA